jgi:murein L,D-transpeptidase YcbB/YkuD
LNSCSTEEQTDAPILNILENDSIPVEQKIQFVLQNENLSALGLNSYEQQWLQTYYEKRNYEAIWINDSILTKKGMEMDTSLNHSEWFGIPHKRLIFSNRDANLNWIEKEIVLTAQIALTINDLNNGFLTTGKVAFNQRNFISSNVLDSLLNKYVNQDPDSIFLNQGPIDSNYRFLAQNLYSFCKKYNTDRTEFKIQSEKKDSLAAYQGAKLALLSKGYLLQESRDDEAKFKFALKLFKKHNGLEESFKIDDETAIALNESNYSKIMRASIALDKLRQRGKFPNKYVLINIPEYLLRFFESDTLRATHKIIVGKPETPTPTLKSKIYEIVVFPYWNVPQSIANNEILPAAKANPSYFSKNNFKIYGKSGQINPYAVNWNKFKSAFPYRVVQSPGPKNSLGVIKFEFHNKYGVYLHDTPSKNLFNKKIRAFSHGCMRCQNPADLAKVILKYDSIPNRINPVQSDSLDSLLISGVNTEIKLKKPVPIFVEYQTVFADRKSILFYKDIYQSEKELVEFLSN